MSRLATTGALWRAVFTGMLAIPHSAPAAEAGVRPCVVIAHRGASGYRPEHTLDAYRVAIEQGADYIEPDLVMTRDGVLVARHENELRRSTDVEARPEFAGRWTRRKIDAMPMEGWFAEDFTLAELRQLRAREPMPEIRPGNRAFDGVSTIPTLEEVIALVREMEAKLERRIGIYPELKHPAHFRALGLDMEGELLDVLRRHGLDAPNAPVLVQSFDGDSLRRLARRADLRLVQLLGGGGPAGRSRAADIDARALRKMARYAAGIGIAKQDLVADASAPAPDIAPGRDLVRRAHEAGLFVHAYTLRAEPVFLPKSLRDVPPPGGLIAELHALLDIGIDGFFIDQPDLGRSACDSRPGEA